MTRLIFVRHGQTQHNKDLIITSGRPGAGLTEEGRQQAVALGQDLVALEPGRLLTSPLLRARQTADLLAQPLRLKAQEDVLLCEMDVGALEGQGSPEAFKRFDASFDHWYKMQDLDFALGPGGETALAALGRFDAFLRSTTVDSGPDDTIVVVSHGTFLQLALTYRCDNLTPLSGFGRWIANAAYVDVEQANGVLNCHAWSVVASGSAQ